MLPLQPKASFFFRGNGYFLLKEDGWPRPSLTRGAPPATPAAEGVPHGGMGEARTDGAHPVTGPILKILTSWKKRCLFLQPLTFKS